MKSLKTGQKTGKAKGVNVRNGLYLGNKKPLSAE